MGFVSETPTDPVARLIGEFNRLPGIGPKSAQRLAFHILRISAADARALAEAIVEVKSRVGYCSTCFNLTEMNPCAICRGNRDHAVICVVEEPLDVMAIERTGAFRGVYHVLHGTISPMDGIGPEDIRIRELIARLNGAATEVILALNPNLEGDATTLYIQRLIEPSGIRVTRLARGLPAGGDLEYADELTLTRAFEGRRQA
ncbi:MAG: recombination protein RecR [Chloroflexota bacterium]|nr:MAG: recombination protein RecR [Chloroflexota bacterium]